MERFGAVTRRTLFGLALAGAARAQAAPRSEGPRRGSLLLVGGGGIGDEVKDAARRMDGGADARWVLIPTAADDAEITPRGTSSFVPDLGRPFTVLHTRDRSVADTEAFAAPLADATAVWFEGGRQTRIAEAYGGTATERALRAVLDRGGLMAGTSAGATIQGSVLVRGLAWGSIDPAPKLRAFDYLHNVAIDQHVNAWKRERDLVPLVTAHPGLLGLGLDEGTAAEVHGDLFSVIGPGRVLVTDGRDHGGVPYEVLRAGDRYDLARWARA